MLLHKRLLRFVSKGLTASATAPAPPPAANAAEPPRGRRKYDEPLSKLVDQHPGITVAQAARELGVAPPGLYQVIRRLETENRIRKTGRGLYGPATPRQARSGKYDDALVAAVRRSPGLTVAEAAALIEVHPTALYPVIRRVETAGSLVKLGRELHPR